MGYSTNVYLYPQFFASSSSTAFPAMVCVYVSEISWDINKHKLTHNSYSCFKYVGAILGIVYGMDAFVAYKDHKEYV